MIHRLYERILEAQISKNRIPACVAIVLSSGDLSGRGLKQLRSILDWCRSTGLGSIMLYVNDDAPEIRARVAAELANAPAQVSLHTVDGVEHMGDGVGVKMTISIGYGGKHEVIEAFRSLLQDVQNGSLDPEDINEESIEAHLRFSQKPDLVIRAGGKQLSDFMIWQAAYSELYFTDVNWGALRKIDFLRAIRDWQRRDRRFGR